MDFPVGSSSKLVTRLLLSTCNWSRHAVALEYSLAAQNVAVHVTSFMGVKELLLTVIQQIWKLRAIRG